MSLSAQRQQPALTAGSTRSFRFWLDLARRLILLVDGPARPYVDPRDSWLECAHIQSGSQQLEARFVRGAAAGPAAVLIFHGLGDRLDYWKRAQFYLAERGFASLIFHYSGYGQSGGETTPLSLERDSLAAHAWLRTRIGPVLPLFQLGFSLGSGLALEVNPELLPRPAGVILCQSYTSLRRGAARLVWPFSFLARLLPDVWRSLDAVAALDTPLLIVHSDADKLFPVRMARELYARASASRSQRNRGVPRAEPRAIVELAIPRGYPHNWIYAAVPPDYWAPILDFMERMSQVQAEPGSED
jgi:alpha-beta hydrolase superfamily lysophospholipase